MKTTPKYRRILLKLSGEALAAGGSGILNDEFVMTVAGVLKKCLAEGVQIGVIVGAGNIWRGRQGSDMDPTRADSMGMLNEKAPNEQVIKLKSIEAMEKVANGNATKIIIPSEMQGLVGMANGLVEGVKE